MKKRIALFLVLVFALMTLCSCYYKKEVDESEVGLKMDDGVSVNGIVGPGRYTNLEWYADLYCMDTSSKTLTWTDDDVWTSDKQSVTFGVDVTYARKSDEASVRLIWKNYNAAAKKDSELEKLVLSRTPRIVKQITNQMTLDEMLSDRITLQNKISELLGRELSSCGVQLIDFGVNTISVDPAYQAKLQEKSIAAIEIELAAQRAEQLEKQLEQEKAQTEIDLEKARRANLVAEEQAKVFAESREAYELKRLELLKGMLGESDKVYFIPEGTDITLFLGNEVSGAPIPVN